MDDDDECPNCGGPCHEVAEGINAIRATLSDRQNIALSFVQAMAYIQDTARGTFLDANLMQAVRCVGITEEEWDEASEINNMMAMAIHGEDWNMDEISS
jgi:hypothetical protein